MHLDGAITREMYDRIHNDLTASKKALENSRKNIELMSNSNYDGTLYLLKLSRMAPDLFENAEIEEKRILLNTVLSNLELNGKELRWKLKEPYDCMALCNENQNWLGIWFWSRTFTEAANFEISYLNSIYDSSHLSSKNY